LKEPTVEAYPHRIGFNLLPHIGDFDDDGYSAEEIKLKLETAKILGRDDILISPTCVRVPVFNCHCQVLNITLKSRASCEEVRDALSNFPGVEVVDGVLESRLGAGASGENNYPLPSECTDRDEVFVGRIRLDDTVEFGVNLWSVMDNLQARRHRGVWRQPMVSHGQPPQRRRPKRRPDSRAARLAAEFSPPIVSVGSSPKMPVGLVLLAS